MNDIDILVTAPLPPFLYEPLKASYICHDYAQAADKAALLGKVGPKIRGLVQGGGTVTPEHLLDALPKLDLKPAWPNLKFTRPLAMVEAPDGTHRQFVLDRID